MRSAAIIYLRVSTEKQGSSGLGLAEQRRACEAFCAQEQLTVLDVVEEVASGGDKQRPVLTRAIRQAHKQHAFIVVARLCRLSRSVHFVSGLMEHKVPFISCEFGRQVDSLILHIFSAVYEQQRRYISERTKAALKEAKARGVKLGNPQWGNALNKAWTASVSNANDFALQMEPVVSGIMQSGATTYQSIADALNNRGIPTRSKKVGAMWHPMTVKNLLVRIEALKSAES